MQLTHQQLQLTKHLFSILKPKPNITGAEWADKYFYLSAESSSLPGKWKTRPYQKDIINSMTDLTSKIVIVKKATRIGYNKMLNITQGFFIEQQPSVILFYAPNADEAKGTAEDEIEPMIRDNKLISALIETPNIRGRIKKEKTVKKVFPGGYLEILGAESDRNLNRRTARVVIGDEVDTWKREAGKAGDTVVTMMRRTSDFEFRKNIIGGKPVGEAYSPDKSMTEGTSIIDYWYKRGDQRKRYLPCPHCGYMDTYEWEDFVWDKKLDKNGKPYFHDPDTVHIVCKSCEGKIYDHHKRKMDEGGEWRPTAHSEENIVSYHIWAMLSYSPNVTWADIVREFLAAKRSKLKMKAFYNEVLARTWEEDFQKANITDMIERKEDYLADVPEGVLILTFGVDTQDDRLECEIVGWGADEESWSIDYKIFTGDTNKPEVWELLDAYLLKTWTHESGALMRPFCGCVDTGGHRTKAAYEFCRTRFSRRVFAVKGSSNVNAPIAPRIATKSNLANIPLYMVGVNTAKDVLMSHLETVREGAGYMHFPRKDVYNAEYFKQLNAEVREPSGKWRKERDRNEAIDCRVYAYASLFIAGVDLELMALRKKPLVVKAQHTEKKRRKQTNNTQRKSSYLDEF